MKFDDNENPNRTGLMDMYGKIYAVGEMLDKARYSP